MGIFSSFKKSLKIKKITKEYFAANRVNFDDLRETIKNFSNYKAENKIPKKIFDFLSSNSPFNELIHSDPYFSTLSPEIINKLIEEFESYGHGAPTMFNGHNPAISALFFTDTLGFLLVSYKNNKGTIPPQLVQDIVDFFAQNKNRFIPTEDPRNPQENNES